MDKREILDVVDACVVERLAEMPVRPRSGDVRQLSLTCQQVLYEVYHEERARGAMGQAEDILRNDNIKRAIAGLPESVRQIARDVLTCAHARLG